MCRSYLARSPRFFTELFAPDKHTNQVVDGHNVYEVDGRACDFSALLDALYGKLTRLVNEEPSFFTLACLLRASHRWEIVHFREWALHALKKRWPPTLDQVHCQGDLTEHATRVIVLFRECEETGLLKRAFYRLLSVDGFGLQPLEIVGSKATAEGQTAKEYHHEAAEWTKADSKLAREDILRVIRLHAYTTQAWRDIIYKPPSYSRSDNPIRWHGWLSACDIEALLRPRWHMHVTEASFSSQGGRDPLGCLTELKKIQWEKLGVCQACATDYRNRWEKEREDLWTKLGKELGI